LRRGDEHWVQMERGVDLLIGPEAISDADERGMRTVMCILNGQLRPVSVCDRSIASQVLTAEQAVITVSATTGHRVKAGQTIATRR
jgi:pyruvate carboxylase